MICEDLQMADEFLKKITLAILKSQNYTAKWSQSTTVYSPISYIHFTHHCISGNLFSAQLFGNIQILYQNNFKNYSILYFAQCSQHTRITMYFVYGSAVHYHILRAQFTPFNIVNFT